MSGLFFIRNKMPAQACILFAMLLLNCTGRNNHNTNSVDSIRLITARCETKPVPRTADADAADDPAIWIDFKQPDSSRIIGTDKQGGLAVYDLQGNEIFYYNTGRMNNADLRYGFPLNKVLIDILAASNRTDQSICLYKINSDGSLSVINKHKLLSRLKDEVYGLCMFHDINTDIFYVFVSDKNGQVEQWELFSEGDSISGKIVRTIKLASQIEGMVADDEAGVLYVGEEDTGIWRYPAQPDSSVSGSLIEPSTKGNNKFIEYDIEGLALYKKQNGEGYLIASSQGNSSYALFTRKHPNKYVGSFRITDGPACDGSEETDGLDATSFGFGNSFPSGFLVVQDGHNYDNDIAVSQNFKIVNWDSIAVRFNPVLK